MVRGRFSTVVAPMRLANSRSASAGIVWSPGPPGTRTAASSRRDAHPLRRARRQTAAAALPAIPGLHRINAAAKWPTKSVSSAKATRSPFVDQMLIAGGRGSLSSSAPNPLSPSCSAKPSDVDKTNEVCRAPSGSAARSWPPYQRPTRESRTMLLACQYLAQPSDVVPSVR